MPSFGPSQADLQLYFEVDDKRPSSASTCSAASFPAAFLLLPSLENGLIVYELWQRRLCTSYLALSTHRGVQVP